MMGRPVTVLPTNLTWKPAVTTDGTCVLMAAANTSDQQAITNATDNDIRTTGGYDRGAYLFFDGTDYYVHYTSGGPTAAYLSDSSLNVQTAIYGSSQWHKLIR